MPIKLLKIRGLATSLASNIFALLCASRSTLINGRNNRTSATRSTDFLNTSGAPLDDAAGYPKLFRPRWHFCREDFRVSRLVLQAMGRGSSFGNPESKIGALKNFVGVSEQ